MRIVLIIIQIRSHNKCTYIPVSSYAGFPWNNCVATIMTPQTFDYMRWLETRNSKEGNSYLHAMVTRRRSGNLHASARRSCQYNFRVQISCPNITVNVANRYNILSNVKFSWYRFVMQLLTEVQGLPFPSGWQTQSRLPQPLLHRYLYTTI